MKREKGEKGWFVRAILFLSSYFGTGAPFRYFLVDNQIR